MHLMLLSRPGGNRPRRPPCIRRILTSTRFAGLILVTINHILIHILIPIIILILIHHQAKMEALEAARLRMQASYDQVGFLIENPNFICLSWICFPTPDCRTPRWRG